MPDGCMTNAAWTEVEERFSLVSRIICLHIEATDEIGANITQIRPTAGEDVFRSLAYTPPMVLTER